MKRKIVWVVVSCLMVAVLVLASCGPAISEEQEIRVFTIENDAQGIPRATRGAAPEYLAMADALGQPSEGRLAPIGGVDSTGEVTVSLFIFTMEPGETIATHAGSTSAICYILQGEGRLTLKGGTPLDYQPNDCIIFMPETLHSWENGDEVMAGLYVDIP